MVSVFFIMHHQVDTIPNLQILFVFLLVPVSTPVINKKPLNAVVEDKANITWTCSVEKGTRVVFQWFRDSVTLGPGDRYYFSQDKSTLLISPVRKEDKGTYHCVASNAVSLGQHSRAVDLNVYCEYKFLFPSSSSVP